MKEKWAVVGQRRERDVLLVAPPAPPRRPVNRCRKMQIPGSAHFVLWEPPAGRGRQQGSVRQRTLGDPVSYTLRDASKAERHVERVEAEIGGAACLEFPKPSIDGGLCGSVCRKRRDDAGMRGQRGSLPARVGTPVAPCGHSACRILGESASKGERSSREFVYLVWFHGLWCWFTLRGRPLTFRRRGDASAFVPSG